MINHRQAVPDRPAIRESMAPAGYPKNTCPVCTLGTSRTNPSLSYQGVQVPIQTWTPSPHTWVLDSVWCLDIHHPRLQSVSLERDRTHDKRATSLPSAHTQVCAQDNKSVTCLDGLCNDRSLTDTYRESSVTKLCPASMTTQPLTPTNTQTISLSGHHFSFPPFIFSKW